MKKDELIKHFKSLTPAEILAEKTGKWSDYELLDVMHYFGEERQRDREAAVTELILRSPENSEMIAYDELYFELANHYRWRKNFPSATRWFYANFAYDEQHDPGLNRDNRYRDLAETHLAAGEFDAGLALLTRRLQTKPGDIWIHNSLGMVLPDIGLSDLAVEVLERALALTDQEDPENLRGQLKDFHQDALDKVDDSVSRLDEIDTAVLTSFRAALQLPIPEDEDAKAPEPYLPPLDQLMELGAEQDETLYAEILAQGSVLAPDLIRMAFDEALWGTAVSTHAVTLLRELHTHMPELDGLAHWLKQADGDWPINLLTKQMGKIGGYTTPELEAIAADTNYHHYIRTSATAALVAHSEKLPNQREHIIHFFRTLLTRPEAHKAEEELFIAFLVSDISDMGAQELYDEVKQVYDEDRIDPTVIDFPHIHKQWGLAPLPLPKMRSDGLELLLRCKACGRERFHFVQHVLVDIHTRDQEDKGLTVKYDPHVMDREIICPKCHAVDQYELTSQGSLRLYMHNASPDNIMAMLTGKPPSKPNPNSYMTAFKSVSFGRLMHPLVALDKYQQEIANKPDDAILHLRMGNLLRTLRRKTQMLETYRRAYELAPEHLEICLTRGMAEHDYGDHVIAKAMYEEVVSQVSPIQMMRQDERADIVMAAMEGLKNLKRGKASPYQLPGSEPSPASPKRRILKPKQRKKKRRRR